MDAEGREIASSRSLVLDLPPSCIEFCPAHPDHFVVGTYNLQKDESAVVDNIEVSDNEDCHEVVKKPQSRNGSLVVHILRIDDSWGAHQTSSAPIITHTLEAWTVAFSPFLADSQEKADDIVPEGSYGLTIYSGGDDSKLLGTTCFYNSLKGNNAEGDDDTMTVPYPIITAKGHTAGVTAILPLSLTLSDGSRIIATGSYDDCFRIYSIHPQVDGIMIRPPKLLAEENLGGGVWRLKLVKLKKLDREGTASQTLWSALILVSCMHAGSRVLEISGDYSGFCQIKVLGRFEEHQSMNYGSDFQPVPKYIVDGVVQVINPVESSDKPNRVKVPEE
ncbi:hypothetical protein O1611_g8139 [Lasiodiplodia mahajangana]|uniref:Uncharacterized protein n=1 Tax=Lasiodiplodia mahajangana TaxID=1108764 RepID=A0ACC2JDI4_9PEZI|nr:hypothetical protein O1611_g8139 [Lasiodiplodia mahajangana]